MIGFFEAPAGSSRSGGINQLPSNPFSRDGYMIVFADGSVRLVPDYEVETLIWNP